MGGASPIPGRGGSLCTILVRLLVHEQLPVQDPQLEVGPPSCTGKPEGLANPGPYIDKGGGRMNTTFHDDSPHFRPESIRSTVPPRRRKEKARQEKTRKDSVIETELSQIGAGQRKDKTGEDSA